MNEIEILRTLAKEADKERAPQVDISRNVISSLRDEEDDFNSSWAWIGGLSLAGALPAALVAYDALDGWMDPLQVMLTSFRWMIS